MKKIIATIVLGVLWGCSDGELQLEALDFNDTAISYCGTSVTSETQLLFKISGREAIILELEEGLLQEVADTTITSQIPGNTRLVYRLFSDDVSTSYFCDELPPAKPIVVDEAEATEGELTITTSVNANDPELLDHNLQLSGINLENDRGERITDLRINEFGIVSTTLP